MLWRYGLTTLFGGLLGEVMGALERRVLPDPLNGLPSASIRMRLENPMAKEIISRRGDVMLKVYQDVGARVSGALASSGNVTVTSTVGFSAKGSLMIDAEIVTYTGLTSTTFTGCTRGARGTSAATHLSGTPILPLRLFGDCLQWEVVRREGERSLAANFAGAPWRLQHRLAGKLGTGVTYSSTARGAIITDLVNTTDAEWGAGIVMGDVSSFYPVSITDPRYFKPIAELISEFAAIRVVPLVIPTWTVADPFNQGGSDHNLIGHSLVTPSGQTWGAVSTGDTDGIVVRGSVTGVDPAGVAVRVAANDAAGIQNGHRALAGTSTFTDVIAQVDLQYWQDFFDEGSIGMTLRDDGNNNYLLVVLSLFPVAAIQVVEVIGGTPNVIRSYTLGATAVLTWYHLIAQADATGDFAVWFSTPPGGDYTAGLRILGHSENLKTGGPLASGKAGLFDHHHDSSATTRLWDSFDAAPATASLVPQDLNTQFVPEEPGSYGTNSDGVTPKIQIATLNVTPSIGTVRPDLIFELGRTLSGYSWSVSREGLLTQAYVLSQSDVDVRTQIDGDAVKARGLFEEVLPEDFGNPGLNQAWADANVNIRKTPREILAVEMAPGGPVWGKDYFTGDTGIARDKLDDGTVIFNGNVRVYAVEISDDQEGKVTEVPRLVPE